MSYFAKLTFIQILENVTYFWHVSHLFIHCYLGYSLSFCIVTLQTDSTQVTVLFWKKKITDTILTSLKKEFKYAHNQIRVALPCADPGIFFSWGVTKNMYLSFQREAVRVIFSGILLCKFNNFEFLQTDSD